MDTRRFKDDQWLAVCVMSKFQRMVVMRLIVENVLLFLLQFTGLMFGSFYFSTGTACAFMMMRGNTILPGIFLGGLFAYLYSGSGYVLAFECSIIFALQAFLFRWMISHYVLPTLMFNQLRQYLKFIFIACLLTAFVSGSLNDLSGTSFFFEWWLVNLNGILTVTVAISTLDMYFPQAPQLRSLSKIALFVSYGSLLCAAIILLFVQQPFIMGMCGLFILINTLMLTRLYGWCGSVAANFMLGLVFALASYMDAAVSMLILQALLFIVAVLGLGGSIVKAGL